MSTQTSEASREKAAMLYVRIAVGTAFLSAVAGRFGLWHGTVSWAYFQRFYELTAQVNAFMPKSVIPLLAWTATVMETLLGILLLLGLWVRRVAIAAAILLAVFAIAMTISQGLKEPMDYSVFSASSAALLLGIRSPRHRKPTVSPSFRGV
jgi:uncharacterized membrane protein YphA (DoxX/SURF4 family)